MQANFPVEAMEQLSPENYLEFRTSHRAHIILRAVGNSIVSRTQGVMSKEVNVIKLRLIH
jgi:hypothetical protein